MKTLYIDCGMGAAGDMLTAALTELLPDKQAFVDELNALGIPGVRFLAEPSVKCGITGTHMSVIVGHDEEEESVDVSATEHEDAHEHGHHHEHEHEHEHHHEHEHEHSHEHHHDHEDEHAHRHEHEDGHGHEHEHHSHGEHTHADGTTHSHSSLADISHIVNDHLAVSEKVKSDVLAIYTLIAEAEAKVHGTSVDLIHFHEVGSADAIADITAVCLAMEKLGVDRIIASPVHVGSGFVRCAHGVLPVPAPATAAILSDVPIYGGRIKGELCTPTGAAILKHFADKFGDMPPMRVKSIGYGMGKKDFEICNAVRVMLGESDEANDVVVELQCNVDDMTPEAIGFATEQFLANGAFEAYTVALGMKKNRPGILLCVMCREEAREKMLELIFKHTTTIGVREHITNRYILKRRMEKVSTPLGDVRKKVTEGYGVSREKYEFDDLAEIAKKNSMSLEEVRKYAAGFDQK